MRFAYRFFCNSVLFLAVSGSILPITAIAQNTVPVSSGMILRYTFSGNNADSSVSHNDLNTGGSYGVDRHNRADETLFCSGATQLTAANPLSIGRDFSATTWMRLSSLPPTGSPLGALWALFSIEDAANLYFNLGVSADSGVGFRFSSGGNPQPFLNAHIDNTWVDEWHHVAITRQDFMLKMFINSHLVDSVVVNSNLVDGLSNPLFVGGSALISRFGLDGYFHGSIDELRIYDRAITPTEVDTLAEQLPVAVRPHINANSPIAQVWERNLFWQKYPTANLWSLTGAEVSQGAALPGVYVWSDGLKRRRLVLQ